MGFRFRKSISIGKHMRINLSKGGIGFSVGIKGLRVGTGPRGTHLTASLPGTGISYVKKLGGSPGSAISTPRGSQVTNQAIAPPGVAAGIPDPGFLAPKQEKVFAAGLKAYRAGDQAEALRQFQAVAPAEPGAAFFAAMILGLHTDTMGQAISLLEGIVQSDDEFPTPLMAKYVGAAQIQIGVTPQVEVTVPVDGLAATLCLVEFYQSQGRIDAGIGLLEEVAELANSPVLTLSLCELFASQGIWDGVIDKAQQTDVTDNVTMEIATLYGRAMLEKNLHEAAISIFTKTLRKQRLDAELLQEARYWRAVSYLALGKNGLANKEFQKLYAEAPTFRDVAKYVGIGNQ